MFTGCQQEKADYAALIDGEYEISKAEVVKYYEGLYYEVRFSDYEYKGYGKALDEVVTRKLKQIDFIDKGLHQNEELMSNIQRVINEELLVRYFDTQYLGQYITDEVIEDYYDGLGREVSYQQIVLYKDNADNVEELKEQASAIKERAENSEDFTALVKEYSENSREVQRDGKMPTMTWEQGTATPRNQIIFRMPENTVRVVETPRQLLVVKVNAVKEVELRPLEEIRTEIYEDLREIYSPRAFSDYDRDKANLIDESEFEWNTEGLSKLVEWSKIEGFYRQEKYKEIIQDYLDDGNNFEILKYGKGTVDLEKYLYLLDNVLLIETSANAKADDFKQFIDEALRTELIVENARELGLDEDILSLNTQSPVILDEYVRLYNQEFIYSRIPEQNSENYEDFYESTKDSLFYQPDKVNLHVKIYDSEDEAQEVMDEINSGKKFQDIFRSWSVKSYIINKDGEIESFKSNEPNYLGDEAFKLSQGETAGPVKFEQDQETKFAVIKANNVVEEKILTLDDMHPRILRRMFRNYYFNKFSKEIAEDLREKYTVEINESVLIELSASNE